MAFADDGTPYAVSGNMSIISHGLFTVDTANGQSTLIGNLGNGSEDGEALAYNPDDGLLYHAAGLGNPNNNAVGEILETIDPATCVGAPSFACDVTNVPLSGFDYEELTALVYVDGGFFAGDLGDAEVDMPRFFRITTTGVVTYLGDMDHVAKGFVVAGPANLPALPAPMLGVLAASLLVLGSWWLSGTSRAART